jgi:hypothetical protein
MFALKHYTLAGFEPGPLVPEENAMSTELRRRQGTQKLCQ